MFVILVGADLYGRKHNVEIGFPDVPSMDILAGHCEAVFRNEARRLRPAGQKSAVQRFIVDNIKIFDDSLNRWLDLSSPNQLVEWAQLYLLQPEGVIEDSQGVLEAPIRVRSPVSAGNNKEKFFFLFHDMDFNGNGHLNREEIQRVFNVMSLYHYAEEQVDEMFHTFDTNRDGVLSYAEFSKWMAAMPQVGEDLLQASVQYWKSWNRRPDFRDSSQITAQEREAILQYLERGRTLAEEMRLREEQLRRDKDEKLITDRTQELQTATKNFANKYGRVPGNGASPNRTTGGTPSKQSIGRSPQ